MTCGGRRTLDLEDSIVSAFEQIDKILFRDAGTHVDGIECLFGGRVAQILHEDLRRLHDIANQANMDFDAYRNRIAEQVAELEATVATRIEALAARLERATTCSECGTPLTTAVVHRARIGDVEHRWHPACCAGRCGSENAHPPAYTEDADVPARPGDVSLERALELQTGVH